MLTAPVSNDHLLPSGPNFRSRYRLHSIICKRMK